MLTTFPRATRRLTAAEHVIEQTISRHLQLKAEQLTNPLQHGFFLVKGAAPRACAQVDG
jgi:hypothetical protein